MSPSFLAKTQGCVKELLDLTSRGTSVLPIISWFRRIPFVVVQPPTPLWTRVETPRLLVTPMDDVGQPTAREKSVLLFLVGR